MQTRISRKTLFVFCDQAGVAPGNLRAGYAINTYKLCDFLFLCSSLCKLPGPSLHQGREGFRGDGERDVADVRRRLRSVARGLRSGASRTGQGARRLTVFGL
ncbi:hypothetical protein CHELA40_13107 [Chelatococcus asaccharovorans]|nr:hypothetical protein CHELA40_13107 [Chelatococcus asaccharovorans]CAH1680282.1 hypothetical protein CHELA17_62512 [Chelatococcus asaccharovorans]